MGCVSDTQPAPSLPMHLSRLFLFLWLALAAGAIPSRGAPATPEADAAATLVIFNQDDPTSASLAARYGENRGIPEAQRIGLKMPLQETITRAQYDEQIAGPLRQILIDRGWWRASVIGEKTLSVDQSAIRFVVLMRGTPLKIATEDKPYTGDRPEGLPKRLLYNRASVDSELARLGLGGRQISGPIPNPFYGCTTTLAETPIPGLLLVCRLDAAAPETVERMIEDSTETEKAGLWGFAYIDSRNIRKGGYLIGDQWMRRMVQGMTEYGIPCIHEDTGLLFPDDYPMRHAALYFGWYSAAIKGPFPDERFRFTRGAVAVHIYSYSAQTLRGDPKKSWCLSLLKSGAAATLGNVYEPYLQLTPDLSVFERRLREGSSFAEAAYAAEPVLSWMTTFVGDPLYRPFKGNDRKPDTPAAIRFAAYREGAQTWFKEGAPAGKAALSARGEALQSGVIFEGLATLQGISRDWDGALLSLEKARSFYHDGEDQIRCSLHAIGLLANKGDRKAALALAREQIAAHPATTLGVITLIQMVERLETPSRQAGKAGKAGKKAKAAKPPGPPVAR